MRSHEKAAILLYVVVLVALLLAVFTLIEGSLARALSVIKDNLALVALSSTLIASEEALKSTRFLVLSRASGRKLKFSSALEIHFSSLAVGVLTPAFSGSVPTATAMIGDSLGLDIGEALSLALGVSFFDSAIPSLVVIAISWAYLPESALALLIALVVLMAWSIAFSKRALGLVASVLGAAVGRSGLAVAIREEAERFRKAFARLTSDWKVFLLVASISIVAYFIESLSVLILAPNAGPYGLLKAFEALMLSYVGGNLPTPGGEGGVEYGLAIILPRAAVVLWRVSYLIVALTPLLIINKIVRSYLRYAAFSYNALKQLAAGASGEGRS